MAFPVIANLNVQGPVAVGGTVIGGCLGSNIGNTPEVLQANTDGSVHNRAVYLASLLQNPSLRSQSIAALLGITSSIPYNLASGAGLVFYAPSKAQGGGRSTGRSFTMANGIFAPTSLSCTHQTAAEITYGAFPISSNAILEPVITADSVAIPTIGQADEQFGLGPVSIGGFAFNQFKSMEIDFGITIVQESADDSVFATFAYDDARIPSVTFKGVDILALGAARIPLQGLATTIANTTWYLRKRANAGTHVADVTAEHIKFQMAGMAIVTEPYAAEDTGNATLDIQIFSHHDGTNEQLLIDTASAIS